MVYSMALKQAEVHAELHVYAEGEHGCGLRHTALPNMGWLQLVEIKLHTIKILPGAEKDDTGKTQ
jgi:hypothetical protein